jgi:uncharacterized RDD family membrane protein YckC
MQTTYTQTKDKRKTELADLGTRLLAFSLDILLLLTLIGIADYFTFSSDDQAFLLKPERLLHLMLGWLYFAGTETCRSKGTLGKYLMHLRVTDSKGNRLSFRAATLRFFTRPVSVLFIILRILVSPNYSTRRPFHDRVAASQVVQR